jgi:hypothetical protein
VLNLVEDTILRSGTRAGEIRAASLVEAANVLVTKRLNPEFGDFVARLDELNKVFEHPSLPRKFLIKRDPFDSEFSIWYLLVDLIDLKKTLKGALSGLLGLSSGRRRRYRPPKKFTARDIADKHLGIQFGLIPTVRDIQDFISTINRFRDNLKNDGSNGKRYVSHSQVQKLESSINYLDLESWSQDLVFAIPHSPIGYPVDITVTRKVTATWHGEALYGFICPELRGWVARLCQICDSFGILDPAAVWDVIPFSFIVDWFYSVSTWLHNNRPRLFRATSALYDYLESVKVVSEVSYMLNNASILSNIQVGVPLETVSGPIGKDTCTEYIRRRFTPPPGYVQLAPRSGGSNSISMVALDNRIGISTSLAAQRLPR